MTGEQIDVYKCFPRLVGGKFLIAKNCNYLEIINCTTINPVASSNICIQICVLYICYTYHYTLLF